MDSMPNRSKHTKQSAFIHLVEELGEIGRQMTNEVHRPEKFDAENLGTEFADVLMFVTYLAHFYNINLSKEMDTSIKRMYTKVEEIQKATKTT
jgi:NTP pyrophosphatase (non-canonical NTP hydrolase)